MVRKPKKVYRAVGYMMGVLRGEVTEWLDDIEMTHSYPLMEVPIAIGNAHSRKKDAEAEISSILEENIKARYCKVEIQYY